MFGSYIEMMIDSVLLGAGITTVLFICRKSIWQGFMEGMFPPKDK